MIQAPADLTRSCSISTALWLPNTRRENLLTVGWSSVPSCLLLGSGPVPGLDPGIGSEAVVVDAGAAGGALSSPGVAPSLALVVGLCSASMTPVSLHVWPPRPCRGHSGPPTPPGVGAGAARLTRSGGVVGWEPPARGEEGVCATDSPAGGGRVAMRPLAKAERRLGRAGGGGADREPSREGAGPM